MPEIDYSKYSLNELMDVHKHIDRDAYSERFQAVEKLLREKTKLRTESLRRNENQYNVLNKQILKAGRREHFSLAWPGIFLFFGYLSIATYFYFSEGAGAFDIILKVLMFILFFTFIPQLVLHLRYWQVSKDMVVNQNGYEIEINIGKKVLAFEISSITSIDIYLTTSQYFSGKRIIPSENYTYGTITNSNGERFVITGLIDEELFWIRQLKPSITNLHWRFLCLV